jgi:hypothetical protein
MCSETDSTLRARSRTSVSFARHCNWHYPPKLCVWKHRFALEIVDCYILFKHRTTPRSSLKTAGCVLGVSIFLGWNITDADTWLHTDSSTIQMTTSTATTSRTYSRDVSENFTATEKTSNDSLVPHVCLFIREVGGGLFPNNRT